MKIIRIFRKLKKMYLYILCKYRYYVDIEMLLLSSRNSN